MKTITWDRVHFGLTVYRNFVFVALATFFVLLFGTQAHAAANTVVLTKNYGYEQYSAQGLPSNTVIDASAASWIHDNDDTNGLSNPYPILVHSAPGVILSGGQVLGNIDQTTTWREVYDLGNAAAIRLEESPNAVIRNWRITNTWDALRVSWNTQNFIIENVWVSDGRDDAVENDKLNSGTIRNSLFDGVFAGISVDPSSASPIDGSDEVITIEGVLMRLKPYLYEGQVTHASIIKTDSATDGAVTPQLRFINNVFAIQDVNHRSYRSMFNAWDHTIESSGNYFLNLSDTPLPSGYPKPPAGWTVLQGQAARDYWKQSRDKWVANYSTGSTSTPIPPSSSLRAGDRVATVSTLNVRGSASTAGVNLGTQNTGARGTLQSGPVVANGYNWWNINYDVSPDGWSAEDWLVKVPAEQAVTADINANPQSITTGQSATLSWTSTNASSCTGTNFTTGGLTTGSVSVKPLANTTYTIRCANASTNASDSAVVGVTSVPLPPPVEPPPVEEPTPGTGETKTISVRVSSTNDDAEERVAKGSMDLASSDLNIVTDGSNVQIVGVRFRNLAIPKGAKIEKASILFAVDEATTNTASAVIRGQATGDASAFSSTVKNISSRAQTTASASWSNMPQWTTVGAAGSAQRTPELKSVVQEVVNRSDWSSGNDVAFILTGSGVRTAESYDGSSAKAPLLTITYTPAATNDEPDIPEVPEEEEEPTVPVSNPETLTIIPTDDASIVSDSSDESFGSEAALELDSHPEKAVLLKFDVSDIDGRKVKSAKLRLYGKNKSSIGGHLYATANATWSEETVTWDTAPAASGSSVAAYGPVVVDTWNVLDIKSVITGDKTYSFRLVPASDDGADYYSKESSNKPQLVIEVE